MSQAGEPGSGKTAFIQDLAALYGREDSPGAAFPATQQSFTTKPTTLQDFKTAPDKLCTRVLFTDEAAKIHYRLLIQAGPLRMQHVWQKAYSTELVVVMSGMAGSWLA